MVGGLCARDLQLRLVDLVGLRRSSAILRLASTPHAIDTAPATLVGVSLRIRYSSLSVGSARRLRTSTAALSLSRHLSSPLPLIPPRPPHVPPGLGLTKSPYLVQAAHREARNTPLPASLFTSAASPAPAPANYYSRGKPHLELLGEDFQKALANIAAHREQSDKNYYSRKRHSTPTGKTKQQFYHALNSMLEQTQKPKQKPQRPQKDLSRDGWLSAKEQSEKGFYGRQTFVSPKASVEVKARGRKVKVECEAECGSTGRTDASQCTGGVGEADCVGPS